ncbi:hypothetical protein CC77DRAFT_87936 [Alternaria alternata]|uniref:Uncharacterized protein n=1 Tax=Alternaria alternata TaxID=5599 RepID=A0A177DN16_ALTAL|nr:hypothetical protein CC77DRAFT_87936 [Alternaria alternata]OAG20866.1 hypothetical protein CC77DRAFT_87936 [Alternaria alternata]
MVGVRPVTYTRFFWTTRSPDRCLRLRESASAFCASFCRICAFFLAFCAMSCLCCAILPSVRSVMQGRCKGRPTLRGRWSSTRSWSHRRVCDMRGTARSWWF